MSIKFRGNYAKLKKYTSRVDARGRWRDLEYGCKQYRTDEGAVLCWWRKSGKIVFQGHGKAAPKFEQAFRAIAAAEGRLEDHDPRGRLKGDDAQSPQTVRQENETLRELIADLMLKNVRLKKRLERKRRA